MMRRFAGQGLGILMVAVLLACGGAGEVPADQAEDAPPTLIEIMQGLEADMAGVSHGLWVEDFEAIADAARAIADHPQVGPEERTRIMGVLGERGAAFREADLRVHDTAVELEGLAREGDLDGVVETLGRLQSACVTCHREFRDTLQAAY